MLVESTMEPWRINSPAASSWLHHLLKELPGQIMLLQEVAEPQDGGGIRRLTLG